MENKIKFDPTNFNKNFELNEKKNFELNDNKNVINEKENDYNIGVAPHQQPIENIILDIQKLFYQILDMLENRQNPIPFIFTSNKRIFTFSIFLIIIGTLLLILSSLMKSPNEL